PRNVRRAAGTANQGVAGGVVVLRDRGAKPPVLRLARRVGGLPHTDRVEVRERRIRVADALHDGDLARVVERLPALEVPGEAEVLRDRLRRRGDGARLRPAVVVLEARL